MPEYKSEAELKAKSELFMAKLTKDGIETSVKNKGDYMICLAVKCKEKAEGSLKIYHKASKNTFSMNVGQISNSDIKTLVENAWNECEGINVQGKVEEYQEVKYYYNILKKYRDNRIELAAFATLLTNELQKKGKKGIGTDPEKCDFNTLEGHYKELTGEG